MPYDIKRITVLGAGAMGSGATAVFAQETPVHLLNRAPKSRAERGLEAAVNSARSNSLRQAVTPGTYEDDLERAVKESDLILETLGEDLELKRRYFQLVDKHRRPGTIVATGSSGLSVAKLAEGMSPDFRKHFLCIHLYNPPTRLVAVELVPGPETSKEVMEYVAKVMAQKYRRVVLYANDTPAYAGNRIGFKCLNEAAHLADQYGVAMVDYLFGTYTGRLLAPLATIDLVGWDVHKAIVDNVYQNTRDEAHEAFKMPAYMERLLANGHQGDKTPDKGGFFKRVDKKTLVLDTRSGKYVEPPKVRVPVIEKVKEMLRYGSYRDGMRYLLSAQEPEAQVVRRWLLGYISYAGMRDGEVSSMQGINRVMGWGFNWIPADALTELVGLKETIRLLEQEKLPVPKHLRSAKSEKLYFEEDDVERYLTGR
jgi:3-hydroxyacyl-CoA dehydrogenase